MSPPTKRESDYTIPLVVLAAVPLFCAYLGYWQIQRLKWKLELIDELEANLARTPMVLPDLLKSVLSLSFSFSSSFSTRSLSLCLT